MSNYQYRNDDSKQAHIAAIKRLARSQRPVFEMKMYLSEKGYDDDVVLEVIELLLDEKFLNDDAYVQEWLEVVAVSRGYGKRKIFAMLRKRGISSDLIETGYVQYYRSQEMTVLERVAQVKLRSVAGSSFEKSQKLGRFLSSRGFLDSDIMSFIERFLQ